MLRMLCRSGRVCFFPGGCLDAGGIPGGCFATMAMLVDALPPVLLDVCLSTLGGYFATKALSFV
jgi:hypothetical protein